ncbi:hypothetical protein SEA_MAMAPEARL_57 [Arthrobacter phage MamaPearl]|uniref:Uncharacterized protein n=1 Tax=Arthrobacter phage MamaPearl TaxID=2743906 RepID=A0AAE7K5R7_9CAUD|nr:hypothetical protein KDJ03_gp57 [Arthrobacter phage MamaPearl]QDH48245.1 hypothetical protein SEA_ESTEBANJULIOR_57 [Arthrobacter phage EstebanJulior]QKY79127.1 hypothetical protein SEA_MAMAPEARL_57 [Arthrobacter phage MamaPearl]
MIQLDRICINECGDKAVQGRLLCQTCAYRLWQELHWLADVYDTLFEALTRRLNVEEKAEQVKVQGAKDPMVTGLDLNDDAARVRHDIRGIAYAGRGWIGLLNGGTHRGPGRKDVPYELRYLARNLDALDRDSSGTDKMRHWGARVVAARQAAEKLVTPDPLVSAYFYRIENLSCSIKSGEEGDSSVECGGALGVWMVQGKMVERDFSCAVNPGHTTTRDKAILDAHKRATQAKAAMGLIQAILGKGATK